MKGLKVTAAVLGVGLAGGAIALFLTNPDQEAYETYAVTQLQSELSTGVCEDIPPLLEGVCGNAIESNDELLGRVVQSSTTRRNYYVLSIYETNIDPVNALIELLPSNLSLSIGDTSGVPRYQVATVGILGQFFTYEAKQQES